GLNGTVYKQLYAWTVGVLPPGYNVVIRERKADDTLVKETALRAFGGRQVTNAAPLPSTWTDANGPWVWTVDQVMVTIASNTLVPVFVEFKLDPATAKVEVAVTSATVLPTPSVVVGIVEACPSSEADRWENATAIQTSTIATIQNYL